jgi:hypothetical protein
LWWRVKVSIINPTPGDLLDRLSSLAHKIPKARAANKPYLHFQAEQDEILQWLNGVPIKVLEYGKALKAVNGLLWEATEEHRTAKDLAPEKAKELLIKIWDLNQERVSLKEQCDRAVGAWKGSEKV